MKEIPLTQGKVAIVDDEDYEWLNQWKWYYSGEYAVRHVGDYKNRKRITMHGIIMHPPERMQTDHINRNKLDNRRCNLRICTPSENQHNRAKSRNNSGGYKGIYWFKKYNKWAACIRKGKKNFHLGVFTDKIEAAKAYDKKAQELFGEFAYLNFSEGE